MHILQKDSHVRETWAVPMHDEEINLVVPLELGQERAQPRLAPPRVTAHARTTQPQAEFALHRQNHVLPQLHRIFDTEISLLGDLGFVEAQQCCSLDATVEDDVSEERVELVPCVGGRADTRDPFDAWGNGIRNPELPVEEP